MARFFSGILRDTLDSLSIFVKRQIVHSDGMLPSMLLFPTVYGFPNAIIESISGSQRRVH
jgi:hypothetical protein